MEWDLKLPPWDLAELDRDAVPGIGSVVGPSGGLGCQANLLDCSVDLKLGRLGELGPSDKWKEQAKATAMVPPPSGSSKRARMPSNSSQNASCSVDGCRADLSNCREYHRRHKVCEVHSKTPVVMVGGQEQRFCQQCSRFHLLIEFDEVKRSCRKRLDGHNRRRRKSQPDSINSANVFPPSQGPRFSSYPQIFSTATSPNWAGIIQTERDSLPTHCRQLHHMDRQHLNSSLAQTFKEGKQFPFLQDTDTVCSSRTAFEISVHQPLHKIIENSRNKMFSEGLVNVLDSDCALSLLSTTTQTSGINVGQMVPAGRIPVGLPLVSSMQYGDVSQHSHSQVSNSSTRLSCSGMGDEHVGTVLVSDASDTHLHCQSMFHAGCQGSSNGTSSSIPFPWQ